VNKELTKQARFILRQPYPLVVDHHMAVHVQVHTWTSVSQSTETAVLGFSSSQTPKNYQNMTISLDRASRCGGLLVTRNLDKRNHICAFVAQIRSQKGFLHFAPSLSKDVVITKRLSLATSPLFWLPCHYAPGRNSEPCSSTSDTS
jgi:hypothetical protein